MCIAELKWPYKFLFYQFPSIFNNGPPAGGRTARDAMTCAPENPKFSCFRGLGTTRGSAP